MDKDSLKNVLVKEPKVLIEKYALQSSLSDIYGSDGLKVFSLIDGKRTGEEIIRESGLSEDRVLEILNFVEKQGFISVEKLGLLLPPRAAEKKPEVQKIEIAPPLVEEKAIAEEKLPRTPMEKKLYDRFGSIGIVVYHLVDEVKNPEDILKETKLGEDQLIKILQFMVQEGIIKLERAEEKPTPPPKVEMPVEVKPEPPKEISKVEIKVPEKPVVYEKKEIYLPTKKGIKFLDKLLVRATLLRKYGNDGVRVFSQIDSKKASIRMVKDTKISIDRIDEMLRFLSERGVINLKALSIDEIRERYGDEGVTIYNRYGRDGVLLYELIDKRASIRDIVQVSKIPPKSAVEIFAFIHKILGLDIPLDVQLLKKQLGIAE